MKVLTALFIFLVFPTVTLFAAPIATNQSQALTTAGDVDIRDIKGVITQPGINPQWYWIVSTLLLLLLIGGLFLYLKKIRQKKQHLVPAHEKALQALEAAQLLMTPEQSRKFAVRMADILRRYIGDRFHITLQNLTTREFLSTLTKNPDSMHSDLRNHDKMLRNWLNHCDLVKFARYRLTTGEMEEMYNSVADFIGSTQPSGDEK